MAIKTGSTYISQSTIDISSISTANLAKLTPGDCDDDQQPEMGMWPPERDILISLELDRQDDNCNSNSKSGFFDHSQCIETDPGDCNNDRELTGNCNMDVLLADLAISDMRSLSQ